MRLTYRRKWTAEEEAILCTIVDDANTKRGDTPPWEDIAEKLVEKTGNIRTEKACSTRFAKMAKSRHTGTVGSSPRRDQMLRNIASAVLEWLQEELYEVPE
jgi:hypothetical protein